VVKKGHQQPPIGINGLERGEGEGRRAESMSIDFVEKKECQPYTGSSFGERLARRRDL